MKLFLKELFRLKVRITVVFRNPVGERPLILMIKWLAQVARITLQDDVLVERDDFQCRPGHAGSTAAARWDKDRHA